MRPPLHRRAIQALLLLAMLPGCRHKEPAPPPQAASAPPITPATITVITPLPSVPPQAKPNVQPPAPAPAQAAAEPPPPPVKPARRLRKKSTPPPATEAAVPPPALAAAAPSATTAPAAAGAGAPGSTPASAAVPPEAPATSSSSTAQEAAPALGELSTGTKIGARDKTRMLSEIQVEEGRLSKAKEPASTDAQAVLMQIRSFLTKARQAVAENDLDGAETLNTKARVLLNELQNE